MNFSRSRGFSFGQNMPKINIVDTNNYARIKFETDAFALRSLFEHSFRDPEPYIFVFDGRNAKASRREIFPGYKVGRVGAPDNFYRQLELFQELLMYTNKVQLKVDNYEADDVIYSMVNNHPELEFLIHSNDGDFMRLVNDRVSVSTPTIKDVPPAEIRLYKTLKGDQSDKVPGIRLFGDKAWQSLTFDHKQEWLKILRKLEALDPLNKEVNFTLPEIDYGLSKSQTLWVNENWRLLRAFWFVVDFQDVPSELMGKNTKVGTPRYELGDSLLKELLL